MGLLRITRTCLIKVKIKNSKVKEVSLSCRQYHSVILLRNSILFVVYNKLDMFSPEGASCL